MELPAGPRPTLRDIEEAKTPATSMTIGRPGVPAYKDAAIAPVQQPAPHNGGHADRANDSNAVVRQRGVGALATVHHDERRTGGRDARWNRRPSTVADRQAELPESERVPSLLRPWYATNPMPQSSTSNSTSVAAAAAPQNIGEAVAQSSLGRQLSMANTEDLRTPMTASIDAQVKHEPRAVGRARDRAMAADGQSVHDDRHAAGAISHSRRRSERARQAPLQEPCRIRHRQAARPPTARNPDDKDEEPQRHRREER